MPSTAPDSRLSAILDSIDRAETIGLAQALVRIPSVTGQEGLQISEYMADWLRSAGIEAGLQHVGEGRANVWGRVDGANPGKRLLLNGHLDTKPGDAMTIDLGGLSVAIETYLGHTDTDLIVRVPDQNVVYTGDLLVNGQYPTNLDGYPSVWRATLGKFATFDKDTIFVPGHGPLCGLEGVAVVREIFDDIAGQAEKSYKAGVPVEEAVERYAVPDKWKNFRMFSWGFTAGRTIEQLYGEWGGASKPLSY